MSDLSTLSNTGRDPKPSAAPHAPVKCNVGRLHCHKSRRFVERRGFNLPQCHAVDTWTSRYEPGHPIGSAAPGVMQQQLLQVGTVVHFGVQVFVAQLEGLQVQATQRFLGDKEAHAHSMGLCSAEAAVYAQRLRRRAFLSQKFQALIRRGADMAPIEMA
jgi:hypothetical protein